MNKTILQAQNKAELEELIKKYITLEKDETYVIKEIKKPFSLLFFNIKGKYEISILKKSELKKVEKEDMNNNFEKINKTQKKEIKHTREEVKKEIKKEASYETSTDKKKIDEEIANKFNRFLETIELRVNIEKIETKNTFKIIHINGKDARYLIGEKGIALNSLEKLFNNIKEFKNYKILIDSNDYKSKREEALRIIANKKAEKVLKTKTYYKLSPMSARERRIIHEEISNYSNLKTESYGEEPKRYLVIKYVEKED